MGDDSKNILLVDDDITILTVGKNVLSDIYHIFTASSAKEMFELLNTNKPDLILLDIDMPLMDGYEAIKKLKEAPDTRDIPVIFLTGKQEVNNKLEGYSLGAVDYITKPFEPEALLSRIRLSLL